MGLKPFSQNFSVIESIIPAAAEWFAKLHSIDSNKARNFNKMNSRRGYIRFNVFFDIR